MAASDEWRTPPELFSLLDSEFHFDVDVASSAENRLAPYWYGPQCPVRSPALAGWVGQDGLEGAWSSWGTWFMNHPYSASGAWIRKAAEQGEFGAGVGLIPYMPSESWWGVVDDTAAEVRRIPHRVKFMQPDGTYRDTARFPSAVVVWRPRVGLVGPTRPRYVTWDYR